MAADGTPESALGHWSHLCEGLQASPQEFYKQVEAAIEKRAIPDTVVERVEYRQGGVLSDVREYLRVRRRREVFDVCGAPFGNDFFFSWWVAEVSPALPKGVTVIILFAYLGVVGLFMKALGVVGGITGIVLLIPVVLYIVSTLGTPEADDFIMQLPIFGQLYERFFRPITYYRIDTSEMFHKAVQKEVMNVIDQVTEGAGIRPFTELERKPVMRDFFKK